MTDIKISKSALFGLIQEGIEAYAIKYHGQKNIAIETHAQLWGTTNRRLPFKCEIKHISVCSSAERTRGSVSSNPEVLKIKKDIASVFGEDYQHLGTFHTHPYIKSEVEDASQLRKNKLYNFSYSDYLCEITRPTISVGKHQFSIALVMTIFSAQKADDRRDGYVSNNLYEFSLGNLKIWLKAQVYKFVEFEDLEAAELSNVVKELKELYPSESDSKIRKDIAGEFVPVPIDTNINCEFFTEQGFYLKEFGRLAIDDKESTYRTASEAEKRWFA